jgi:teichuronic acid biosynthesis glycosyltransferase TuaG
MLVSIIMPFYNDKAYVSDSVHSIINQSFKDWELIIIDDCSPQKEAVDELKRVGQLDSRISVLKTPINAGSGKARNMGIKAAKGRYIAFCDSDDWWYPTKLEEQLHFMIENEYEFTCSYFEDVYEDLTPFFVYKQPLKQSFKDLIKECTLGTGGVVYDTKRIGKIYMPDLRRAQDWGTWLKIIRKVDYVYTYPKVLWKYRHVVGSASSNKLRMSFYVFKVYRTVLNYSVIKALYMFLFVFLLNNIKKKSSQLLPRIFRKKRLLARIWKRT